MRHASFLEGCYVPRSLQEALGRWICLQHGDPHQRMPTKKQLFGVPVSKVSWISDGIDRRPATEGQGQATRFVTQAGKGENASAGSLEPSR